MTFLSWAAEPEHDERKQYGLKAVIILSAVTAISLYVKRFKWSPIKARKIGELRYVHKLKASLIVSEVYNPPVDKKGH